MTLQETEHLEVLAHGAPWGSRQQELTILLLTLFMTGNDKVPYMDPTGAYLSQRPASVV